MHITLGTGNEVCDLDIEADLTHHEVIVLKKRLLVRLNNY